MGIIAQNRNIFSKPIQTWRFIHVKQLFKWNELDWTTRLPSTAGPSLGHVTFDLVRIGSSKLTHFTGLFALNTATITKILLRALVSMFNFHIYTHLYVKIKKLNIETKALSNILVIVAVFSAKRPVK